METADNRYEQEKNMNCQGVAKYVHCLLIYIWRALQK